MTYAVEDDSECLIHFVVDCFSSVDILIRTPGHLVNHIKSIEAFTLGRVQWRVIAEADT